PADRASERRDLGGNMRRRYVRSARPWFVVASIVGVLGTRTTEAGNGVPMVPVSWCALQGSNAATGTIPVPSPYPGQPAATTTDGLLWRRHERATDNIYPQVPMTFRSAINNPFNANNPVHFPVINDTTTGAGKGQLGDVLGDPIAIFSGNAETLDVVNR